MRQMCKLVCLLASTGFVFIMFLIGWLVIKEIPLTEGHQWLIGQGFLMVTASYGIGFGGKVGQKHMETRK